MPALMNGVHLEFPPRECEHGESGADPYDAVQDEKTVDRNLVQVHVGHGPVTREDLQGFEAEGIQHDSNRIAVDPG